MRVLVTGATGLLGNNLVRLLLESGRTVRALVRRQDDRSLSGLDIRTTLGSVEDPVAVARACENVDWVVHAAGDVHIGWTGRDRQLAVNVQGTRNIVDAALAAKARMIHVSTVNALGLGTATEPATETTPAGGAIECGYVTSKRLAEQLVARAMQEGLSATIVNPGFVLGPWDWKPSSGKMLLQVHHRFTPFAPRGGCSVCDVRDVAHGILTLIDRRPAEKQFILAGENMTYLDLWTRICRTTGSRPPIMRAGPFMCVIVGTFGDLRARWTGRENDVNSASLQMSSQFHYYDSRRAEQALGYRSRPVDKSIRDAWNWFREYGYA
ncbi:MAG: NAD-dependent epimerase/dehydratase family protein [Planctomycetes bacterium]|nr:NAD-dependent epimerase/dehydratase family protein [Planctomycetota bacterium]